MCVALSGYAIQEGRGLRIIQWPDLECHEEIWKRYVAAEAAAGQWWATRAPDLLLENMVSWEYPLHLGAFGRVGYFRNYYKPLPGKWSGGIILENGLKQVQLPPWWDSAAADKLFGYIDNAAGDWEALYEWMQKNKVEPTEEHSRCLQVKLPDVFVLSDLHAEQIFDAEWRDEHGSMGRSKCVITAPNGSKIIDRTSVYEADPARLLDIALKRLNRWAKEEQCTQYWYDLWPDPANRIPAWRTEEEQKALTNG